MKKQCTFITLLTIFSSLIFSCGGKKEGPDRKEAMNSVVDSSFVLKDSVIHYKLDTNSIVFTFPNKPGYTDYSFHFWISKRSNDSTIVYHNAYSGKMGYVVKDQTIRIDDLDLHGESPDSLYVMLEIEPYNTDLITEHEGAKVSSCIRYVDWDNSKKLVPFSDWYKRAIFINYNNLDKIKDKEVRKFCEEQIRNITKNAKYKEIKPEAF